MELCLQFLLSPLQPHSYILLNSQPSTPNSFHCPILQSTVSYGYLKIDRSGKTMEDLQQKW